MMLWRDLSISEKILSNGPGYVLTEEDEKTLHRVPQIDFPNMKSQVDVISNEVRPKLIPLHIANVEFEYGPAIRKEIWEFCLSEK